MVYRMNHNDRLTRLRYALDIKDTDMVKIFELGGASFTKEEVRQLLKKKILRPTRLSVPMKPLSVS